jgi:hypothetical protein
LKPGETPALLKKEIKMEDRKWVKMSHTDSRFKGQPIVINSNCDRFSIPEGEEVFIPVHAINTARDAKYVEHTMVGNFHEEREIERYVVIELQRKEVTKNMELTNKLILTEEENVMNLSNPEVLEKVNSKQGRKE